MRFFVFSQADYIVTAGTASTNAVKAMGIAQEKIVTLFNPVDVSWFYAASKKYHILDSPGHRFIYVGQLIDRKNVAMLLRAFSAIRNEADTLTIVGDGPTGSVLKNLADSLGISDSVIFIGHKSQDELAALYGESNTLVLPSVNEVWGLVVNEALASGLHAVISDKCGVANFASNMQGAYIFPIEQKSLQEAMRRSANEWSGHIENPEILRYTPEKFADELLIRIGFVDGGTK
jgi:glycosyltransferase involved in cell wall biosynthesis